MILEKHLLPATAKQARNDGDEDEYDDFEIIDADNDLSYRTLD